METAEKQYDLPEDLCDCVECKAAEQPCRCDCDRDAECIGCQAVREGNEEEQFDIDCSTGKR